MTLPRYHWSDDYILEELRREYLNSDSRRRISILRKLNNMGIPWEIANLAFEDSNTLVRQWFARNAKSLDYSQIDRTNGEEQIKLSERNLRDRLQKDPDHFLRACLYENPNQVGLLVPGNVLGTLLPDWLALFTQATCLERLALVRNPRIGLDLMEKIFDPESQALSIDMKERTDLVCAFLTNKDRMQDSWECLNPRSDDLWMTHLDNQLRFSNIWKLIAKWPEDGYWPLLDLVYQHIATSDETKAEVYPQTRKDTLRVSILQSCSINDVLTVSLGMEDSDEECRECASKILYKAEDIPYGTLEAYLKSENEMLLEQLSGNSTLSSSKEKKIRDRLASLESKKRKSAFWTATRKIFET